MLSPSASAVAASAVNAAGGNPNPTETSSSAGASGTSQADSAASSAPAFQLPGKQLSVLPIGLAVFAGISVIALIVVGLVTYERTKYRRVSYSKCAIIGLTRVTNFTYRRSASVSWPNLVLRWDMVGWRECFMILLSARVAHCVADKLPDRLVLDLSNYYFMRTCRLSESLRCSGYRAAFCNFCTCCNAFCSSSAFAERDLQRPNFVSLRAPRLFETDRSTTSPEPSYRVRFGL